LFVFTNPRQASSQVCSYVRGHSTLKAEVALVAPIVAEKRGRNFEVELLAGNADSTVIRTGW
jgi:hypothetical protein